jgi:hypothetical protein
VKVHVVVAAVVAGVVKRPAQPLTTRPTLCFG